MESDVKLAEWLAQQDITQRAFAVLIESSQSQVARFGSGQRIPNKQTMRKIVAVTHGDVTPLDFYDPVPTKDRENGVKCNHANIVKIAAAE